ncbi:MAG: hypothetical protein M1486_00460 [Gammaproteobacteria bacterium]|nr:hypothetical protein [Gammaproteobacteria bacterium]
MSTDILSDDVMIDINGGILATQLVSGVELNVPADTGFYNVLFTAGLAARGGIAAIDGGIPLPGDGVGAKGIAKAIG